MKTTPPLHKGAFDTNAPRCDRAQRSRAGYGSDLHDHAYCGETAAPSPVPVQREAGAVVVVASAVVLLAAWAFARLLCATTRVRRRHYLS